MKRPVNYSISRVFRAFERWPVFAPAVGLAAGIDATSELGKSAKGRAAKSDALDPALQEVIAAWNTLPAAIRDAVRVMVRAGQAQWPRNALVLKSRATLIWLETGSKVAVFPRSWWEN